jgi:ATP-dependent exoDNAse (exonuclease V) beta subunit
LSGRPDTDLLDAVADFRRWLAAQPVEPKTLDLVGHLETLANHFSGSFATPAAFDALWRLVHPERLPCMRRHTFDLLTPRTKAAWEKVAGKDRGQELNDEASRHFARVDHCYRVILGRIATALVAKLSDELDEVLADYAAFKRAAAVLDFDDLLERARELVREHDAVRCALGRRYRHVFVDEFQDTDPIQAEILFRIAAEGRASRWQDSVLRDGALFVVGDPKQSIYRFRGADVGSYGEARSAIARRWPDNIVQITANFRSRPAILNHINHCFEAPLSRNGQPGYVGFAPTIDPPDHDLPCVAKITINTATLLRSREPFVHRADDDTLHWVIGDVVPPELLAALETDSESLMRERERLWYVACTRARELLIVPELPQAEQKSGARILNLGLGALPTLDLSRMTPVPINADPPNAQTAERFAAERVIIDVAAVPLTWIRPSDYDPDRISAIEAITIEPGDAPEVDAPGGAGRVRGLLLHKLMEEVLTGELAEEVGRFAGRVRELLAELVLAPAHGDALPDAEEIAATAWRTLQLPEIAALRTMLVPEWPVYGLVANGGPNALAGRIDAIAYESDRAEVVIDWKSDVDPDERDMRFHAGQLKDYLRATGAARGALVYMTPGFVRWVGVPPGDIPGEA